MGDTTDMEHDTEDGPGVDEEPGGNDTDTDEEPG